MSVKQGLVLMVQPRAAIPIALVQQAAPWVAPVWRAVAALRLIWRRPCLTVVRAPANHAHVQPVFYQAVTATTHAQFFLRQVAPLTAQRLPVAHL